jgi:hypothetical protein
MSIQNVSENYDFEVITADQAIAELAEPTHWLYQEKRIAMSTRETTDSSAEPVLISVDGITSSVLDIFTAKAGMRGQVIPTEDQKEIKDVMAGYVVTAIARGYEKVGDPDIRGRWKYAAESERHPPVFKAVIADLEPKESKEHLNRIVYPKATAEELENLKKTCFGQFDRKRNTYRNWVNKLFSDENLESHILPKGFVDTDGTPKWWEYRRTVGGLKTWNNCPNHRAGMIAFLVQTINDRVRGDPFSLMNEHSVRNMHSALNQANMICVPREGIGSEAEYIQARERFIRTILVSQQSKDFEKKQKKTVTRPER